MLLSGLVGCGSSDGTLVLTATPVRSDGNLMVTTDPGPSPFIAFVHVTGFDIQSVTDVQYTIAPMPNSVSEPVHVEYSIAALEARGYVSGGVLTVPIFGLYANFDNPVSMELATGTHDPMRFEVDIPTPAYVDPSGIYSQLKIMAKRDGGPFGFDFIYIKSALGSPIILDTDGNIRWAAPGITSSFSSVFDRDSFIIGSEQSPIVYRLGLDGTLAQMALPSASDADFQHDINHGKEGQLAELDLTTGGIGQLESNLVEMEVGSTVTILKHWDLGAIIGNYMSSQGDDAAAFVRPGTDWFHMNSSVYDPANDSVIISSRENFVIDLDYNTGAINWILGDPTKYWYTFPSLRAKALALTPGGLYPIGQHAVSLTPAGHLMLFNDGEGSINEPAGQPAGQTRTYTAVSVYSINQAAMTASNLWNYDASQQIFNDFCGSAYEQPDGSVLVDYARAEDGQEALLVGLGPNQYGGNPLSVNNLTINSTKRIIFEFAYPNSGCNTSWNARPFPLNDLRITR
jgi:arylsulfate sulfotransferase